MQKIVWKGKKNIGNVQVNEIGEIDSAIKNRSNHASIPSQLS